MPDSLELSFIEKILRIIQDFERASEFSMDELLGINTSVSSMVSGDQDENKSNNISEKLNSLFLQMGISTKFKHNNSIWSKLKSAALRLGVFEAAVLFTKLDILFDRSTGKTDSEDWYKVGLEIHRLGGKSEAHVCFILASCDFELLAETFFDSNEHRSCIEYYLWKNKWSSMREKAKIAKSKHVLKKGEDNEADDDDDDSRPTHFWYYAEIVKHLEVELEVATTLSQPVQELIDLSREIFPSEKEWAEILVWIFRTFPEIISNEEIGEPIHAKLRDFFAQTSSIKALGAYHFSAALKQTNEQDSKEELSKFHKKFEASWPVHLSFALATMDFDLLANTLERMRKEHLDVAQGIFQARTLGLNIEEFSSPALKATLYLLRGTCRKLSSDVLGALEDYKQAFTQINFAGVVKCLAKLVQDPAFHANIIDLIRREFDKLFQKVQLRQFMYPHSNEQKLEGSFAIFGKSTKPTKSPRDLCPTPGSTYLTVIRKNEVAIEGRLGDNEPLKAAFAYLDLCMSLGDPGGLQGAQIMAANYFLEAMKSAAAAGQLSLVYSYREVIYFIAAGLFLSGKKISTPFLKSYAYITLFNILMAANEIFVICLENEKIKVYRSTGKGHSSLAELKVSAPLLDTSQTALMRGLLVEWFGFVKIAPILLIPPQLAFDTVFLDVKGLAFLKEFLKEKLGRSDHPLDLPKSLFAYYQFEGVWNKWLIHKEFMEAKVEAMEILLEEKGWNGEDVEEAFEWNGCLYNEDGWRHIGEYI